MFNFFYRDIIFPEVIKKFEYASSLEPAFPNDYQPLQTINNF